MHYKYRWWYIILLNFILLGTAYFYDIRINLAHLLALKGNEKASKKKLSDLNLMTLVRNDKTKVCKLIYQGKNQTDGLFDLVKLFNESGLVIESIRFFSSRHPDRMYFKVTAKGFYKQFLAFILLLNKADNIIDLLNFSIKMVGTQPYFVMDLLSLKYKNQYHFNEYNKQIQSDDIDPFCMNISLNTFNQADKEKKQATSISAMKMVGFLHSENETAVLMQLPDNTLVSFHRNEKIGLEDGLIISIDQDHIVILLPHHEQLILKMASS